jgi:OOP family OmpA-OmpF porin
MKRSFISAVVAAVALQAAAVQAEETAGFSITPSIGYMIFDGDRALKSDAASGEYDDNEFWSLGLGYRFNNPWQVELVYLDGETDTDRTAVDVDFYGLRLDGLYHLSEGEKLSPYLAIGAGHAEYEEPGYDREESNANFGGGVKYALNKTVSLRSDARAIYDFEDDNIDYAITLGLQFLFGQSSSASAVSSTAGAVDSDNDGVNDDSDRCPGSTSGVQVDSNGCALDDDSDGVPNHNDACPDTEAGAKVKADGCYATLEESTSIELQVNFANNSAEVESSYYTEISAVAEFLKQYPQTSVIVEGHTDSNGNDEYNQSLSASRAKSVATVLVDQYGVDSARVSHKGYGESKPVSNNDTAEGQAENRRVVAVISATVEKRVK